MSNVEADFKPSWGASVFKCKHCGKDGMQWKQIAPETWRPYDLQDKKLHSCDVVKDKEYMQYQVENTGSITLESLLENLELLGFEYFVPRTTSWKFALAKSNTIQTVYFLVGRSGVDFKLYDSVRDNNVDDNGKLYTDGGKLVRNYYWKSNVNIHHLILKVATQLSNNIPIDDEFLTGQGISVNTNKNSTIDVEEYDHSANDSTKDAYTRDFSKKPDGYANIYITTTSGGVNKDMQLGKSGVELDHTRKLDSLIIKMAESNPEALDTLILSIRVTLMDEIKSNDLLE